MPEPNLEHFLLDFLTFFMASCDNLQEIEYFVYEIYLILSSWFNLELTIGLTASI